MEKLSRTKKYQELRESLQNDSESQVVSKELTQFQDRLNRLDVMHFDSSKESDADHDPIHARRNSYFEEPVSEPAQQEMEKTTQYTFNNEYLDEYISEVKQYNKNKGLLKEEDTAMNILEGLKKKEEPVKEDVPVKEEIECDYTSEMEATIPFVFQREKTVDEVSEEVKNLLKEDEDENPVFENPEEKEAPKKSPMAEAVEKELAKEMELEKSKKEPEKPVEDEEDDDESMGTANKILNVVLVILILALLVVLGVVVYWTLLNRGII